MKAQKSIIAVAGLTLIILFAVGNYLFKVDQKKKLGFLAHKNFQTFVRDYSPTLGPDDAKVVLVEFLDPECESCRAFYPFVKKIMADHPNKIKLVVRYMPFHGNSKMVIRILEAARKQGKYWETLETLFYYQPKWGSHHHPRPELIWEVLPEVGLNIEQLKSEMTNPSFDKIIEQDFADGKTLQVRATPTFFINGKALEQFGYQQLEDAIKKAIAE